MPDTAIATLLDRFAAHGDRVALRAADGDLTYAALLDGVYATARSLAGQGIGHGDVVALGTGNHPRTYLLRYAANLLGAAVAVLGDAVADLPVAGMLDAAGATVLVTDGPAVPGVRTLAPPAPSGDTTPLPVAARPEDLAAVRFTGGSTGTPKGIPHDARPPFYLDPRYLGGWREATQLVCTPVGHIAGTLSDVLLAAGGKVVLHKGFDAAAVLAAIARERVTYLWLQPRLLAALLDHPALPGTDTSSLTGITLGGGPAVPRRLAEAVHRFGPIVAGGYAMNEAGQITMLSREEHLRPELLGTVGRPVPGVELRIRDAAGAPVDTGVDGEIWVRGPGMMPGYHRRPDLTARAIVDGWLRTGDLGHLDADGYLTVTGRRGEMITTAGGRVYPARVERALGEDPRVQEAVVFGAGDGGDGAERVCAAVVASPGAVLRPADVTAAVAAALGAAHAPETVLLLDALPVLPSGKPDRAALRALV